MEQVRLDYADFKLLKYASLLTDNSRSAPRNNATSRPYSGNTLRYSRDTYTPLTPNGPIVEVAASSIPNGPLVGNN